MSSTYHILCTSHDPAVSLEIGPGGPGYHDEADAVAVVHNPDGQGDWTRETIYSHRGCDLLISRHSGGVIEITCPGGVPGCRSVHSGPQSVDVEWLRLAYHALRQPGTWQAVGRMPGCWTPERIQRIRYEIGAERYPWDPAVAA